MAITDRLAEHLTSLRFEDLPDDAIHAAKRLILDTLGVARAGAGEPGCAEIMAAVAHEEGTGRSTIWANGKRTSAPAAALINGVAAAALDYDSLHFKGVTHPEIITLPAAMALAERENRSGRDLILAVVAGGDLTNRIALSTGRSSGWFTTTIAGIFGATAGSGLMLGLDQLAMRNALGLALCQCSGTMQAVYERSLAKRMQSAFAARNGVYAAQFAKHGIGGPVEAFEGPGGYYALFEPGDAEILFDGLGQRFEIVNTGIKKFSSCACNHAAIEATCRLIDAHPLRADDITSINVRITPFMQQLVGAPFDPSTNPQVAAQFSVQYSIASVLLRRKFGLDDLTPERAQDPEVFKLARRITVEVDQNATQMLTPATVRIETADRRFEETVDVVPGSIGAALSDSEVIAKFYDCMKFGPAAMNAERGEALADAIAGLENIERLDGLFAARMAA
ncbi:MAG: MmgE/PrpD family protein [Rhodospirillales bacterium]